MARRPRRAPRRRNRPRRLNRRRMNRFTSAPGLRIKRGPASAKNFTRTFNMASLIGVANSGWSMNGGGSPEWVNSGGMMKFTAAAGSVNYRAFGFYAQLSSLPAFSEFTALFQKYKINAIKVKWWPIYNTAAYPVNLLATGLDTSGTDLVGNSGGVPIIHWCYNYDDATAPPSSETGVNTLRQFASYKTRRFDNMNKGVGQYFKPRISIGAQQAGAPAFCLLTRPRWLINNAASVPHNGLVGIIEYVNNTSHDMDVLLKCEVKVYLQCKDLI